MSDADIYYITTAIDYANGRPHLGHALEKIGADVMARYRRGAGRPVHFVIGMDEHGLKVLQSARAADRSPQEWVDAVAHDWREAWRALRISHDDFIRTTQPRHHRAVAAMIRRMDAAGDLYQGTYTGYYCVGCEAYKGEDDLEPLPPERGADTDAEATRPDAAVPPADDPRAEGDAELVTDRRCPIHPGRTLVWETEDNWFFRLSRYEDRLLELYDERPALVQPESRRNEMRRVVEGGLDDLSVSRSRLPWGVPWPDDPEHTVYVWIDALTNYLSAVGFPDDDFERYWPADVHVIGKDITRFHCIYWPAMLLSAGIELPRSIWGHGFVEFGGRKMSKSEGSTMKLHESIDRHGADALRFYLLRDVPWDGDGDISRDRFDERYTSDLANDLGNLANRVLTMIERYRDSQIPDGARTSLDERITEHLARYRTAMDAHLLHQGAAAAFDLVGAANAFVERRAPWAQAKQPDAAADLDATLASLARAVVAAASMLQPFMPRKMPYLTERFGYAQVPRLEELESLEPAGHAVDRGDILFPRPDR